tara:strand:+ start:269 stop:1219 length:951 start_codon:yes stop_codon:yes gene_type:complete
MPRNVYFSQAVRSEQNLYEDLIIESLKIYGQDVYYIPRVLVNRDNILGEDPASKFDDAYLIEMYIENTEGFEGSGDLYSKFGLDIQDDVKFIVSKRMWNQGIGKFSSNVISPRPQEGDLIFLPMTNKFFEISFVEHEQPFYQLQNLPVYKLTCSLFEYSDEQIETGIEEIDDKTGAQAYQIAMDVAVNSGNHFEHSEIVTQELVPASGGTPAIKIFGEVQTITKTSDIVATISVSNIGVSGSETYRQFVASGTKPLVGQTSTNSCIINKVYDIGDNDTTKVLASDGAAQNVAFETIGDNFIDFTESNPFGDPSETF